MVKAFELTGLSQADVEERFGGMYRAFQYGAPPHGGMAAGVDRMVMLLCGAQNLREITLFPMNQRAEDLLMGAPSPAEPKAAARTARPRDRAAQTAGLIKSTGIARNPRTVLLGGFFMRRICLSLIALMAATAAQAETIRVVTVYPAASDEAAALRSIQVEPFGGNAGDDLTIQAEDVLRGINLGERAVVPGDSRCYRRWGRSAAARHGRH
jgi:hypothetical protein